MGQDRSQRPHDLPDGCGHQGGPGQKRSDRPGRSMTSCRKSPAASTDGGSSFITAGDHPQFQPGLEIGLPKGRHPLGQRCAGFQGLHLSRPAAHLYYRCQEGRRGPDGPDGHHRSRCHRHGSALRPGRRARKHAAVRLLEKYRSAVQSEPCQDARSDQTVTKLAF